MKFYKIRDKNSIFFSLINLILKLKSIQEIKHEEFEESKFHLPSIPKDRSSIYKFYNLEFMPDGYPGKRVENKLYAHPMYGAYLLEDYIRECEKQNKRDYLKAAVKIADNVLTKMNFLKEFDALVFFYDKNNNSGYFEGKYFSGLAQARYLTPFAKLYKKTGNEKYKNAAERIFNSLKIPKYKGGVLVETDFGILLEQQPYDIDTFILNGWTTIISQLLIYEELSGNKLAKDLAFENIKTLEKLLPLYDLSELSLSRYMLSGFIYSKFIFSKSKTCKFHTYSTIYNKNEFGLKKTNNRWKNFIFSKDIEIDGFSTNKTVRFNNVFNIVSKEQKIKTKIFCKEPVEVDFFIASGEYNPLLSAMETKSWLKINTYQLKKGNNDLLISFENKKIPLIGYPTNFIKKFECCHFNHYHWVHINNLKIITKKVNSPTLIYYKKKWESYTRMWCKDEKLLPLINKNCPKDFSNKKILRYGF